jgi:hypothetical protein
MIMLRTCGVFQMQAKMKLRIALAVTLTLFSQWALSKGTPVTIDSPIQTLHLLTQLQEASDSDVLHRMGHRDFERWSKEGYRLLDVSFNENDSGPGAYSKMALFRLVNADGNERTLSYYIKEKYLTQALEAVRMIPTVGVEGDVAAKTQP